MRRLQPILNVRVLALAVAVLVLPVTATAATLHQTRSAELRTPQQVVDLAFQQLNNFWAATFTKSGTTLVFRNPAHYQWYDHPGKPFDYTFAVPKGCDSDEDGLLGHPDGKMYAGPSTFYHRNFNSFYCSQNEYVYLDYGLLSDLITNQDDGAAFVVVAHEFGHHIQKIMKWPYVYEAKYHRYANIELLADCYAGLFFQYEQRSGMLDDNDLAHATHLLGNLGDPDHTPWKEPGAHGGHSSREAAFLKGYDSYNWTTCNNIMNKAAP